MSKKGRRNCQGRFFTLYLCQKGTNDHAFGMTETMHNKKTTIKKIRGREILDSRGNPTVEAEVYLDNGCCGRACVPSGASTGAFEAVELRDNDKSRYMGLGVKKAVENINKTLNELLIGKNACDQRNIDELMIHEDGSENKGNLGANAILGVSLACAKAAAKSKNLPLFQYIGGISSHIMPVPMMNILNGGKHADSSLNIQEFMIMPTGAHSFSKGLEQSVCVFHTLKNILKTEGYTTSVGDEGGFAPKFEKDEQALEYILKAIEAAGFKPGTDFKIALDVASTEMYEEAVKQNHKGEYLFWKSNTRKTGDEMISYLENLTRDYPICSIEDGLAEEDWNGWKKLTKALGNKVQLVGDDLFVTNTKRIQKGIKEHAGNAVLIKVNQIGTLTETLDAIEMTKKNGWNAIISHRSGETEDTTIADIAVATNAGQIKTGAPSRTDRVAKYNRLLRIEEMIQKSAK